MTQIGRMFANDIGIRRRYSEKGNPGTCAGWEYSARKNNERGK